MKMMNNMIPLTIANTLDQSTKKRVEVAANQTVKEAVRQNNPTPMDTFDVYNGDGELISDEQAAHHRNSTLYVGVEKVVGGGVPRKRLGELQIEYPSIQPVKQWTDRKQAKMFLVRFPSNGRTQSGFWEIVIHCPNAGSALMHAYVLNFGEITGRVGVSLFANPPLLPTHAVLEMGSSPARRPREVVGSVTATSCLICSVSGAIRWFELAPRNAIPSRYIKNLLNS